MTFSIEAPPKDQEALATKGKEIFDASKMLGLDLDLEGFLTAWVSGIRILLGRDAKGKISSMAFVAVGSRWADNTTKASIIQWAGDKTGILGFAKTIAIGAGATSILFEEEQPLEQTPEMIRYVVREEILQ